MASRLCLLAMAIAMMMARRGGASRPVPDASVDAAVELDIKSFNETLWAAPTSFALVELYASWCPACRNYKPQYERVAKLFNGRNAPHPGTVFVAKVDCGNEINSQLCWRFSVDHYPSLYWGPPGKFAWGGYIPKSTNNDVELIQNTPRTAEALLEWINKRIGKNYGLDDEAPDLEIDGHAQSMLSLQDIEEATSLSYEYILRDKLLNANTRSSFLDFVQLLAVYHPSRRCREGSAKILVNSEDVWLSTEDTPNYDLLRRIPVCQDRAVKGWKACLGSINGTRGYSCGLWLLFHSLSVRVDGGQSKFAMQSIRNFVANFFKCEECRDHFLEMSANAVDMVKSRSDLVLWLWRAHNKVNVRVGQEEAKLNTGDPKFPKKQWPPKQFCKACHSTDWNESAVYTFLVQHYGRGLDLQLPHASIGEEQTQSMASVPDDITSSRVAVPVGAAFGIAMASCGFGLVACYWRTQQKRRK